MGWVFQPYKYIDSVNKLSKFIMVSEDLLRLQDEPLIHLFTHQGEKLLDDRIFIYAIQGVFYI